jgi:hypothetical protein
MRTLGPRLGAGLSAAVVLLSGCVRNPEPAPAPAPTKTPSPSASASPSPPVMPEAAKARTKAGAIAYAKGFIEALNFAGASGDTKALRSLFIPLCTRCEAIADGIDQTYAAGGYFRGGNWTPTSFKFYVLRNDVAVLDAIVNYEAQTWLKSRGEKPITYRSSQNNLKAFNLRWQNTGWKVSALDPNA